MDFLAEGEGMSEEVKGVIFSMLKIAYLAGWERGSNIMPSDEEVYDAVKGMYNIVANALDNEEVEE